MGLERTKFLKYAVMLMSVLLVVSACSYNKQTFMFYIKNGATYLYGNNKVYALGVLSEKAVNCGKYVYYMTKAGELCAFCDGKTYSLAKGAEKYKISGEYVYYTKKGNLFEVKGKSSNVMCKGANDFDVIKGLCIYNIDGKWYFKDNYISKTKPFYVTEKYAYYLKNDVLYYKKYKTKASAVARNVYDTAVIKKRVYFFTENYSEKDFSEVFEYDCIEKDNTEIYSEHIKHKDITDYFTQHKVPFRLYTLYEADCDVKKKIDGDICDISSFYDAGESSAIYKKFSRKKLKLSSLKNINDVYYAADEKYEAADVYVLKNGETVLKSENRFADYFEISDNIYYTDNGNLYAGEIKIYDNVCEFKAVPNGVVFNGNDNAYIYSKGKILKIGRHAEGIVFSENEIYFIDNGNLKNVSGMFVKNVESYKVCGSNVYYISNGNLYKNGEKIDTDVSEIY